MRTKLLTALSALALLAACGPRGAVVYGGGGGGGGAGGGSNASGGGEVEPTSSGFVVTDNMPEECQELSKPCQTCDEVEMTRRRILEKKCVRVCEAYVEAGPAFADNVPPAIDEILRKPGVCGKTETTCTAIERSQCAYAMEYVSVARPFIKTWTASASAPPAEEILTSYYDGVLSPIDGLHRQVYEWGRVNETDVSPLLESTSGILRIRLATTNQEVFGEASSKLTDDERLRTMYTTTKSLSETAMKPAGSFETYQTAWDTAAESFVTARGSAKK